MTTHTRSIFLTVVLATCLHGSANADVVFHLSETTWLATVTGVEALTTDPAGINFADEASGITGAANQTLPGFLTFQAVNTGLTRDFTLETLEAGAGFTYNDAEPSTTLPGYENALSVGDINNFEDDDWQIIFTGGNLTTAFGFELRDNGDLSSVDEFSVFDTNDNVIGSTTALPDSEDGSAFVGFTSDVAIGKIVYNDDSGGDDIAIANFQFGATSVPEPGSIGLLGLASLGLLTRRRRDWLCR